MKKLKIPGLILGGLFAFFLGDFMLSACIGYGLQRYFGLNQPSEVVAIGHSHLMLSLDKKVFEKKTGSLLSKYTREGVNVTDRKAMIEHYLQLPNSKSLKVLFYGVDQYMFTSARLSENSHQIFYPFMDIPAIDSYLSKKASFSDYWSHKMIRLTRFSDALMNSAIRGWMDNWDNYKVGQVDTFALAKRLKEGDERDIVQEPELLRDFEDTLELLKSRGIKVVLINTPIVDLLNQYQPEKYQEIINRFKGYAESSDLVEYWDYNLRYSSDYSLFFDPIHLNPKGQEVITEQIIADFKLLEH